MDVDILLSSEYLGDLHSFPLRVLEISQQGVVVVSVKFNSLSDLTFFLNLNFVEKFIQAKSRYRAEEDHNRFVLQLLLWRKEMQKRL